LKNNKQKEEESDRKKILLRKQDETKTVQKLQIFTNLNKTYHEYLLLLRKGLP